MKYFLLEICWQQCTGEVMSEFARMAIKKILIFDEFY